MGYGSVPRHLGRSRVHMNKCTCGWGEEGGGIQPGVCVYQIDVLCGLFANNVMFPNLWL